MTGSKKLSTVIITLLTLLSIPEASFAQNEDIRAKLITARDDSSQVYIEISNKNSYTGTITIVQDSTFTLLSETGEFKLFIKQISEFRIISADDRTSYWFENISRSRLFITPTARMNEGFFGSYQNIYVLFSNISLSPFDFLTVNLGFINIPQVTFNGDFYSLGIKTGFNVNEKFYVAANATRFVIDEESTTLIYPSVTLSDKGNDLTAGFGINRFEGKQEGAFFLLGGQLRAGERISFVSENFFFSEGENLFMLGPRFLGKRIAVDLALVLEPVTNTTLPFVSFMTTF